MQENEEKARIRTTKGADSHHSGLTMAFKLLLHSGLHWKPVNSPYSIALVHVGVKSQTATRVFYLTCRKRLSSLF